MNDPPVGCKIRRVPAIIYSLKCPLISSSDLLSAERSCGPNTASKNKESHSTENNFTLKGSLRCCRKWLFVFKSHRLALKPRASGDALHHRLYNQVPLSLPPSPSSSVTRSHTPTLLKTKMIPPLSFPLTPPLWKLRCLPVCADTHSPSLAVTLVFPDTLSRNREEGSTINSWFN